MSWTTMLTCAVGVLPVVVLWAGEAWCEPPGSEAPESEAGGPVMANGCVFLSDARLATLKTRIENQVEPTWSAWCALEKAADAALERQPHAPVEWHVPYVYQDAKGHKEAKQGLQDDANSAYALALAYRMTGEDRYAAAAVRLLDAWATTVETLRRDEDSGLSFSYHFPALILAADLLEDASVWPAARQEVFKRFVREKALPMNTMAKDNNWGNWGLVLVIASAAYLEDQVLLDQAVARWRTFIEEQIAEDGHLVREVERAGTGRSGDYGIWYSHFSLMPQTIAAEIARVNGVDLYDYVSPSGRSLRLAFDWLAPWVHEPEKFPYFQGGDVKKLVGVSYASYFEILNAHWFNPDAEAVIESLRPLTANHSAPFLTFTHGGLLEDAGPSTGGS